MKNSISKVHHAILGVIASGFVLTVVASATAGVNVHGSICQVSDFFDETEGDDGNTGASGRDVGDFGVVNQDSNEDLHLFCPVPVGQNVGASQQFNVLVEDKNNTRVIDCRGTVLDELGEELCQTAVDTTGAGSFTGQDTLAFSCNAGTHSSAYSYVVDCFLPPVTANGPSEIQTLRVF